MRHPPLIIHITSAACSLDYPPGGQGSRGWRPAHCKVLYHNVHCVGDQHPVGCCTMMLTATDVGEPAVVRTVHASSASAEVTSGQSSHVSVYVLPGAPRRIHATQY